jgi:hypothetical protein
MECSVDGCTDPATFELDIPWAENEVVCAGHARVRSRQDGVVADPLDTAEEELPEGASHRSDEA